MPVEATNQSGSYEVAEVAGHPDTHAGAVALYNFGGTLYVAFDQTVEGETNAFYGVLNADGIITRLTAVTDDDLTDYQAVSDPAMTTFGGNLVITWCTSSSGADDQPVVATINSLGGYSVSLASTRFSNAPGIVSFNGDLFVFGESYFGDDGNMWGVASTNGSTWETEKEFSFDLGGGPGLAVLRSDLIEVGRAKSNDYLWAYQGTI